MFSLSRNRYFVGIKVNLEQQWEAILTRKPLLLTVILPACVMHFPVPIRIIQTKFAVL